MSSDSDRDAPTVPPAGRRGLRVIDGEKAGGSGEGAPKKTHQRRTFTIPPWLARAAEAWSRGRLVGYQPRNRAAESTADVTPSAPPVTAGAPAPEGASDDDAKRRIPWIVLSGIAFGLVVVGAALALTSAANQDAGRKDLTAASTSEKAPGLAPQIALEPSAATASAGSVSGSRSASDVRPSAPPLSSARKPEAGPIATNSTRSAKPKTVTPASPTHDAPRSQSPVPGVRLDSPY